MSEGKLTGMTVAILATNGFEEAELLEPRNALAHAGAITKIIAPKSGKVQGMRSMQNVVDCKRVQRARTQWQEPKRTSL